MAKPNDNDRGNAGAIDTPDDLRRRLAELAQQQQDILSEMDRVQQLLSDAGVDVVLEADEALPDDESGDTQRLRDEYEQKLAAARADYTRSLADFQNFQRRAVENERRALESGRAGVLESLVMVLDNFDLALRMDPEKVPARAVLEGVKMVRSEMLRTLAGKGFSVIEPKTDEPFDANRHEALIRAQAEHVQPGHIVEVLQPGYALGDRVLRPAKVSVASGGEDHDRAEGGTDENGAE